MNEGNSTLDRYNFYRVFSNVVVEDTTGVYKDITEGTRGLNHQVIVLVVKSC